MTNPVPTARKEISLATWTRTVKRSALQEMLIAASRPGIISLALGLPASELFPVSEYERAAGQVLATDPDALQYGPPSKLLRTQIVSIMAQRGVTCREEQVFLTAGAQQGMNLLARLLLESGGQVLTEEMAYTGFQQVIEPFEPRVLTVPTDLETGIDVDAVETLLRDGARPAFIYAIPDGHNPLGVSMSAEKRRRLVELARRYQTPIMEDDAYGFISYRKSATPPMRALDEQWVLYVGSFSKILAPALRVGWLIVPQELTYKLSILKEATDIDTSTFTQRTVSAYLETGHQSGHIQMLRREYRARRDAMLSALAQHFPSEARWEEPTGGVFIWVELPVGANTDELLKIAIETEQVAFIPGNAFCIGGSHKGINSMRLNFSHCDIERIESGIARLARALKVVLH